jgi:hypothetical protein
LKLRPSDRSAAHADRNEDDLFSAHVRHRRLNRRPTTSTGAKRGLTDEADGADVSADPDDGGDVDDDDLYDDDEKNNPAEASEPRRNSRETDGGHHAPKIDILSVQAVRARPARGRRLGFVDENQNVHTSLDPYSDSAAFSTSNLFDSEVPLLHPWLPKALL